ncbi:MAG: tetratricopeptide repeat protein [Candidatus Aureabacteria bacterium]|nr:tetratricopeptide repeat protein [Candidatus Auribacterota bacterium]
MINRIPDRFLLILIGLFLFLGIWILYFQVKNHDFINYDDPGYITKNTQIHTGLSLNNIIWSFTTCQMSNWHPLTWISYLLDYQLFGLNPAGYHMMNVFLHGINSILFFVFLLLLTRDQSKPIFLCGLIAAVFAFHPMRVESVAWISERKGLLSGLFWILSMIHYLKYMKTDSRFHYAGTLVYYLLGLLSKPMTLTLPFVLWLLDFWPLNRTKMSLNKKNNLQLFLEKIPFLVLLVMFLIVSFYAQRQKGAIMMSLEELPFFSRIEGVIMAYSYYILNFIWPTNLAIYYPHQGSWPLSHVIPGILIITMITFVIVRCRYNKPWLLTGWLFFLGTLIPVIGFIQVGTQFMADRYTYIPHIGLFIMLWGEILSVWNHKINRYLVILPGLVILLVLSCLTFHQIQTWKDSISVFSHAIEVTTPNPIANNNLGSAYSNKEEYEKAIPYFKKAVELMPTNTYSLYNLGYDLYQVKKYDEALTYLSRAIELNPDLYQAYSTSGMIHFKTGDHQKAREEIIQFLKHEPDNPRAIYYLILCDIKINKQEEASYYLQKLKKLNPVLAEKIKK